MPVFENARFITCEAEGEVFSKMAAGADGRAVLGAAELSGGAGIPHRRAPGIQPGRGRADGGAGILFQTASG